MEKQFISRGLWFYKLRDAGDGWVRQNHRNSANMDIIPHYKSQHVKNLKWPIHFNKIKQLQFFKLSALELNKGYNTMGKIIQSRDIL